MFQIRQSGNDVKERILRLQRVAAKNTRRKTTERKTEGKSSFEMLTPLTDSLKK